jgi:beta-N-acetylhexosaminidase
MTAPLAVIFGCASTSLSVEEKSFFKQSNPLGFILFARNIESPDQVRALVNDLRDCVGRKNAPILIDQEGGRVQRLKPPHWRDVPKPGTFATLHESDADVALEAAKLNARLIASDLHDLGIDVNCLPCIDIAQDDSHEFLHGRVSGKTPEQSIALGRAVCDGLLAGGVMPVIKHIPGHGRAKSDSHHELPRILASSDDLHAIDFAPFHGLRDIGWGMTAHVIYEALDNANPASTSLMITQNIIREHIDFDGFLVSDDICMNALSGTMAERTNACLDAGSDAILHCNGEMAEMIEVAQTDRRLNISARNRFDRGRAMIHTPQTFDKEEGLARLGALLEKAAESA